MYPPVYTGMYHQCIPGMCTTVYTRHVHHGVYPAVYTSVDNPAVYTSVDDPAVLHY